MSFHGDALGQIARLVYVTSAHYRHVIGQKLQWNNGQDGHETIISLWNFNEVICQFLHYLIS